MNIIVLVDSHGSNLSMNGVIANNIIQELEVDNKVSVVTYKENYSSKNKYSSEIEVHNILNHNVCIGNFIKKKLNKSKGKSILLKFAFFLKRAIFHSKRNVNLLGIDVGLTRKIIKKLNEINELNKVDLIISLAAPFEMFYSGLQFVKSSKVQFIPIQLDFFSELDDLYYPKVLKKIRKIKRIDFEKQIIENSTVFFALEFLKNCFLKKEYEKYREQITYIQHPLIKENQHVISKDNIAGENQITFVYTGSLSRHERNPKDILEILTNIPKEFNYKFNVFHRGDCNEIIEMYSRKNSRICNRGTVSTDYAYGAINSSDVLISIGTIDGNQIAGKTFDYISAGKPIIYVYYNKNDLNLKYYKNYPLALCIHIDENNYKEHSLRIERFCIETKGKHINFDEIKKKYYLASPEYIIMQILEKVKLKNTNETKKIIHDY